MVKSTIKESKGNNRRGLRRNKNKKCSRKLKLIGFNCAGLASKLFSFDHILSTVQPSIFFIQETKMRKQGRIKTSLTENYQIFELIRKERHGGGLAIGVINDLEPVWIGEGDDEVEILVVQVRIVNFKIRCMCAYGPQEKDTLERKLNFWSNLSEEVSQALKDEAAIIIQMDGNLWGGEEIVKGDPNKSNNNGKLFKEFLEMNPNLTVVNNLTICEGKITRRRNTLKKNEEAILDFFIVCEKIAAFVKKLLIDEDKHYPLARYTQKGVKYSDHNTMIMHLDIDYNLKKPHRIELFNFKNVDCQKMFREKTENFTSLTECFKTNENIGKACKNWFKTLKGYFFDCFTKIRSKNNYKSNNPVVKLMKQRSDLVQQIKKSDGDKINILKTELDEIDLKLIKIVAEENRKQVYENFEKLSNTDGTTNNHGIWALKRKLFPKNTEPLPIAKRNFNGRLISTKNELICLYMDTYRHRLRKRPIKKEYRYLKVLKEELFSQRIKIAKTRKSKPWTLKQLQQVLKHLKSGKSRDPHGLIYELFKPEVSGIDFQKSFLIMANRIKDKVFFPEFMQYANVVSIYKGKGEKADLANDRGIFLVNIFRSIIMKMVYKDKYEIVDTNMSDSNVGARKNKNIRNHLFVINGVINDVVNRKEESVDIQILDYKQCFDSLWLEESINDLWEAGLNDDQLALIAEANENVKVAIKTPFGMTERETMKRFVMQGENFGPICCSVTVDTFGKECLKEKKNLYSYKKVVGVPPLAMIDDLLCISKCGLQSVLMNSFINAKSNIKKLQFGVSKCHKMHVGLPSTTCPDLFVDNWKLKKQNDYFTGDENIEDEEDGKAKLDNIENEKYLGDIVSVDGKTKKNILARRNKGIGIVNQIMTMLDGTCYGPHVFEVGLLFRKSFYINSILTNSESWYGVKCEDIELLEQVDELLLRKLLEVGKSCPKEMLYLETGSWPIRFIIMSRRLMFLHYMLNEDDKSLVRQILKAQIKDPVKNDWILTVREDFEELGVGLGFDDIEGLSKDRFKSFLDRKIEERVLNYLNEIKASHKKVSHILHKELKTQEYLKATENTDTKLAKFIFHARTRMLDVKENFRNRYSNERAQTTCALGCTEPDTQQHLLFCKILDNHNMIEKNEQPKYQDLFSENSQKQLVVAVILQNRFMKRRNMIQNMDRGEPLSVFSSA